MCSDGWAETQTSSTILFVCASEEDERQFRAVCDDFDGAIVRVCRSTAATVIVRQDHPQVIVCDADEPSGWWHEFLQVNMPVEYAVIVVSRRANDALWAEVLSLGGFDVLALPFDRDELTRSLSSALRHVHQR